MTISAEQLQKILQQQQKQFEDAQSRLIELLTNKMSINPANTSMISSSSTDAAASSINEFIFDPDSGRTFECWYRKYEDMFTTDFINLDDASKVRLLLRKLGTVEHERFINFILPKLPRDLSFADTVKIMTQIFGEQHSLFNIRYQCLQLRKKDSEDYITYAGTVNRECERFQLSTMTEDQFKCLIFVAGLQSSRDADIRTRLLNKIEQDAELTLQKLTTECQRLLNLKSDTALIEHGTAHSTIINKVSHKKQRQAFPDQRFGKKPPTPCWFCGQWHFSRYCRYRNHLCSVCGRKGHAEQICSKRGRNSSKHQPSRRAVSRAITATFQVNFTHRRKFLTVMINNTWIRLQLDTGSDLTLISKQTWQQLGQPTLHPTTHTARNASGGKLKLVGELDCSVIFNDVHYAGSCYVTDCPGLDLLGLDWIEGLKLFDKPLNAVCNKTTATSSSGKLETSMPKAILERLEQRYPTVFSDNLGRCSKMQAHLSLLPESRPVFRPKRPVPYAALQMVDEELDRLQKLGVIQPVNYSSWAAPIVVVRKANGSVRLCADFSTGLNDALATHQYPLPLPEDLFAKLNGGKLFAKIDLSDAYLQIEVDEVSRELLTINTHKGLFQYTRLPFGVKSAPAIFQQIMDTMLKDAVGVAAYLDDLIVMGSTYDELVQRLDYIMSRLQDYGFRIRKEKCMFGMKSIRYLGFIIDEQGRRPDPENISAIQKMPPPHDISTLRSFLGLVSHYSNFLPAMHQLRGPLNHLLTKEAKWVWSADCQNAFDRIKDLLNSDLLLTHFDPRQEIIIAADASQYGIGAVISHRFQDGREKAISHAARSLTAAERNYGQIEKEALAIIFAVQKFHKMIYGRSFTLLTDHKPLLAIFGSKKGIPTYTANRLQRWATMLLNYDFKIKYQSTTTIGQADALSRLIASHTPATEDMVIANVSIEPEVCRVLCDTLSQLPITAAEVSQETQRDALLQRVIHLHRTGWPSKCQTGEILPYFHRRESLSVVNGCLLFSERVVIPKKLQASVLKQFHIGHPGINRMKSLARSYVFWPGMDNEIEEMVRSCTGCAFTSKCPVKTDLCSWPKPTKPWSRIHVDYAGPVSGEYYLVVVDAYSKWPEVLPVRNPTTSQTVAELRQLFARFGSPEILVSDNGTQFTSGCFEEFCRQQGIVHLRSPPFHPQSNGQAERFVDSFKRSLQKAEGEGPTLETLQKFLMTYRSTPNPQTHDGSSPAEIIFQRRMRTPHDVIRPTPRIEPQRDQSMERHFNRRHGTQPRSFHPGQIVLVRDYRCRHTPWKIGRVIHRRGQVIYEVQVGGLTGVRQLGKFDFRTALGAKHQ